MDVTHPSRSSSPVARSSPPYLATQAPAFSSPPTPDPLSFAPSLVSSALRHLESFECVLVVLYTML